MPQRFFTKIPKTINKVKLSDNRDRNRVNSEIQSGYLEASFSHTLQPPPAREAAKRLAKGKLPWRRCRWLPPLRRAVLATNAKSRTGITPCGLIRDCWFPSSVTVVISGGERKGSGPLLGRIPPAARRQRTARQRCLTGDVSLPTWQRPRRQSFDFGPP